MVSSMTLIARTVALVLSDDRLVFRSIIDVELWRAVWHVTIIPVLVLEMWLWLPIVSGFLLKAARRFDVGFGWFNRRFDIEKKPLQSIGLVAGALVAVVYWAAVVVARVL